MTCLWNLVNRITPPHRCSEMYPMGFEVSDIRRGERRVVVAGRALVVARRTLLKLKQSRRRRDAGDHKGPPHTYTTALAPTELRSYVIEGCFV